MYAIAILKRGLSTVLLCSCPEPTVAMTLITHSSFLSTAPFSTYQESQHCGGTSWDYSWPTRSAQRPCGDNNWSSSSGRMRNTRGSYWLSARSALRSRKSRDGGWRRWVPRGPLQPPQGWCCLVHTHAFWPHLTKTTSLTLRMGPWLPSLHPSAPARLSLTIPLLVSMFYCLSLLTCSDQLQTFYILFQFPIGKDMGFFSPLVFSSAWNSMQHILDTSGIFVEWVN